MAEINSMTYQELLEARAAGRYIADTELARARRREAAQAEADAETKQIAKDAKKAQETYNAKVAQWEQEAVETAKPLHDKLIAARTEYAHIEQAARKAEQERLTKLNELKTIHDSIFNAVNDKLGEPDKSWRQGNSGYPVDDNGNPTTTTYYRDHRVVVDGTVIGLFTDKPDDLHD